MYWHDFQNTINHIVGWIDCFKTFNGPIAALYALASCASLKLLTVEISLKGSSKLFDMFTAQIVFENFLFVTKSAS